MPFMTKEKTNRVRIQRRKTGQFFVGIPKTLALAYGLEKGHDLEWVIENGGLMLKKIEGDKHEKNQ